MNAEYKSNLWEVWIQNIEEQYNNTGKESQKKYGSYKWTSAKPLGDSMCFERVSIHFLSD
jgi:hypothetical protein